MAGCFPERPRYFFQFRRENVKRFEQYIFPSRITPHTMRSDFVKTNFETQTFRLTIRNKYEALQDLLEEGNMGIDTQWQQIKEMWISTCSEVLGKKKYQQQDWLSVDNNKVALRKEKKVQLTTAEREHQKQQRRNSIQRQTEQSRTA